MQRKLAFPQTRMGAEDPRVMVTDLVVALVDLQDQVDLEDRALPPAQEAPSLAEARHKDGAMPTSSGATHRSSHQTKTSKQQIRTLLLGLLITSSTTSKADLTRDSSHSNQLHNSHNSHNSNNRTIKLQ